MNESMRFEKLKKRSHWQLIVLLALLMPVCLGTSSALAQENVRPNNDWCPELINTNNWQYEIGNLEKLINDGNYTEAEELIQTLEGICARSPMLKFAQGKLAQARGETEKARTNYIEASEQLTQFELSPTLSKDIWYARFQLENQVSSDYEKVNRQILWSGVGVGVGGIALAVTGFALAYHSDPVEFSEPKGAYKVRKDYTVGWCLAGTGIAMLISGVIMSGVAGYRLTKMKNNAFALDISPTGGSFRMTF